MQHFVTVKLKFILTESKKIVNAMSAQQLVAIPRALPAANSWSLHMNFLIFLNS